MNGQAAWPTSGITSAIGYVWQIPALQNDKKMVKALTGGWGFSGVMLFASGVPSDVQESTDSQNTDGIWERPSLVAGQKLSVPNQSKDHWFNTAAFTPRVYIYGDTPRNPLNQQGTRVLNLTVTRNFKMPFAESQHLELRFGAFNAVTRPSSPRRTPILGTAPSGR